MKEIIVTNCGPEQDCYYVINGGDGEVSFLNGAELPINVVVGRAELLGYQIKEVTRLEVCLDATVEIRVDVEGDEDAALERASEIAGALEKEIDKITLLGEDSIGVGIGEPIAWRNEDSGEETHR